MADGGTVDSAEPKSDVWFEIDESGDVVRSARCWRTYGAVLLGAGTLALPAAVVAAVAGATPLVAVTIASLGVVCLVRGGLDQALVRDLARVDVGEPALELDRDDLVVTHPLLPNGLRVPTADVRAAAVHDGGPAGRRRDKRIFPIERPPGSLHPLNEPEAFLIDGELAASRGKRLVRLTALDLSRGWQPNVAILFDEEIAVPFLRVRAPRYFATRLPPPLLRRAPGVERSRGLYLRVRSPDAVGRALAARGVRCGFTSEDWAWAVG